MTEDIITQAGMAIMLLLIVGMAASIAGLISMDVMVGASVVVCISGFLHQHRKQMRL